MTIGKKYISKIEQLWQTNTVHYHFPLSRIVLTIITANILIGSLKAQNDSSLRDGYNVFYYPGGNKASEGILKQGKPDGYWVSYYPSGIKKSEGNRKSFILDSIWIFYNQLGDTSEKLNYILGKKNGYSYKYSYKNNIARKENVVVIAKELYVADQKEGISYYYNNDGTIKEIIRYKKGRKDGISYEFGRDSSIISEKEYRNDYLIRGERVNRLDSSGRKNGIWREYYPDGRIKSETFFKKGIIDGIYKKFNEKGALELSLNYREGSIIEDNTGNDQNIQIKNEYDNDNNLIFSGSFYDSIPVGIHRYFNKNGKIVSSKLFNNVGLLVSTGIITMEGKREGATKFYFDGKIVESEGEFINNQKNGPWKYYYRGGKLEQEGYFKNGNPDGSWIWYFPNGNVWKEEEYLGGLEDGNYVEYNSIGDIITKGTYVEGEKEGEWIYKVGDHSEIGNYANGLRNGIWKYYYTNGNLQLEAKYIQGNLDGKVKIWNEQGNLLEEQYYINGLKQKTWKKFDNQGNVILAITYEDDLEVRINGEKIDNEREVKLIK